LVRTIVVRRMLPESPALAREVSLEQEDRLWMWL
jgi:hypothetical protein